MVRWKLVAPVTFAALSLSVSQPAQSLSCPVGPYIVFFDSGHAYIRPEQREILDNAILAAGSCMYARTMLAGHTDTSEDPALAQKRLSTVRAYLAAHGIPQEDITLESFGAGQPRIPTPDGVTEPQNQRVEVTFVFWPNPSQPAFKPEPALPGL